MYLNYICVCVAFSMMNLIGPGGFNLNLLSCRVGVAVHNLGQFYLGQRKLEEARVSYEVTF